MYGVIILTEYNEIDHIFGNTKFHQIFASRSREFCSTAATNESIFGLNGEGGRKHLSSNTSGISSSEELPIEFATENAHKSVANEAVTATGSKTAICPRECDKIQTKRNAEVFDESTLLTRLMPLVIMCRMQRFASEVQMNGADQESLQRCASSLTSEKSAGSLTADELESIGCANENDDDRFFFQVLDLSHSILAIFIFNKHGKAKLAAFIELVKRLLQYHYHSLIQLIPSGSPAIKKIGARCDRRMELLLQCKQQKSFSDVFNQNLVFGHSDDVNALQPFFKKIAIAISGNLKTRCRCLFVFKGQLISSVLAPVLSSDKRKPLFSALEFDDIQSILQFALLPASESNRNVNRSLKCQIEQAWIYSKEIRQRQLINVFVFSLSDDLDMVCLTTVDHSKLIKSTCDLLDSLETIPTARPTQSCQKVADLFDLTLQQFVERLDAFAPPSKSSLNDFVFLTNIPRTEKLVKNLWLRFRSSLESWSDDCRSSGRGSSGSLLHQFPLTSRLPGRASVSSFFSAHSWIHQQNNYMTVSSSSNTSHSRSTRKSYISIGQLDAMRVQLRRTLRSILDELISYTYSIARSVYLEEIHRTLRLVTEKRFSVGIERLTNGIRSSEGQLKPANFSFDMLTYYFERFDVPFNLHHIEVGSPSREILVGFVNYDFAQDEILMGRTQGGELIIQICTQREISRKSNESRQYNSKAFNKGKERYNNIVAIFPSCVNINLAVNQTNNLSEILTRDLDKSIKNFL